MKIPDKKVVEAIGRLQFVDDFIEIKKWLEGLKNRQGAYTNRLKDNNEIVRSQGMYIALDIIVDALNNKYKEHWENKDG